MTDKYLILDTETTGIPNRKLAADDPAQPHLCELAMLYVDDNLEIEREYQAYIKPDGWNHMPDGAFEAHGLTVEFLSEKGVPLAEALFEFSKAITAEHRVAVAHNAWFDLKILRGELRRMGMPDVFEDTRNICTMRTLAGKITGSNGKPNWHPKLVDACAHFSIVLPQHHSATNDAHACLGLLREIRALGVMPEAKVYYAKDKGESE